MSPRRSLLFLLSKRKEKKRNVGFQPHCNDMLRGYGFVVRFIDFKKCLISSVDDVNEHSHNVYGKKHCTSFSIIAMFLTV